MQITCFMYKVAKESNMVHKLEYSSAKLVLKQMKIVLFSQDYMMV